MPTFRVREPDNFPPDSGVNCSLALDTNQRPAISYWRDAETPNPELVFAAFSNPFTPDVMTPEQIAGTRGIGNSLAMQKVATTGFGGVVTTALKPWVAYYDLDAQSVTVARREGSVWVKEVVESGVTNFAASGIGIAIGSDGQPRICYSNGRGLTFAVRSAATSGWQRDTLAGLNWERQIIQGGALTPGFDIGLSPANAMSFSPVEWCIPAGLQSTFGSRRRGVCHLRSCGPAGHPGGNRRHRLPIADCRIARRPG